MREQMTKMKSWYAKFESLVLLEFSPLDQKLHVQLYLDNKTKKFMLITGLMEIRLVFLSTLSVELRRKRVELKLMFKLIKLISAWHNTKKTHTENIPQAKPKRSSCVLNCYW